MRNSSPATWLVLGIGLTLLVASRFVRMSAPAWLILGAVVLILAVTIGRQVLPRPGGGLHRTPPRNVTPDEARIPSGTTMTASSGSPEVIVLESGDDGERLEAKLQALDRLRANGLVTDAEYEAKRASLIAEF